MEGIITLIVIIIIFNLLNRLVGAVKSKQQPPRGRRAYEPGRPTRSGRMVDQWIERFEKPASFRSTGSADREDSWAGDEEDEEGYEHEIKKEHAETKAKSEKKAVSTRPVSKNLRHILSDKESLVAAFIFHEAISGPPVSRRNRKSFSTRSR